MIESTLAEQLPIVLGDKTAIRDYIDVYQPAVTPLPSPVLVWPQIIIPMDSQWRRVLERLTDPLYGRDLLNMQLDEMAAAAPGIEQVWKITESWPSLTKILLEDRNNK